MNIYRLLIAFIGGYILCAQLSVMLALILPFENTAEAVLFSNLLSFVIWALLFIYSFSKVSMKFLIIQFSVLSLILVGVNTFLGA